LPVPIPHLTIILDMFSYCASHNVTPASGSLLTTLTDGIAAGSTLSLLNYFLLGFAVDVDGWYFHSFEIWLACMVVFPAAGNVSFSLLEYRLGHRSLFSAFLENFTWVPFLCVLTSFSACGSILIFHFSFVFFGGLSIHISQAILAHLFSYNITWGATKKEVERSNFWMEVPKILKRFWLSLVIATLCIITVIVFATSLVPPEWRIEKSSWSLILPLVYVLPFRSTALG
jgi:hypothetical protein